MEQVCVFFSPISAEATVLFEREREKEEHLIEFIFLNEHKLIVFYQIVNLAMQYLQSKCN